MECFAEVRKRGCVKSTMKGNILNYILFFTLITSFSCKSQVAEITDTLSEVYTDTWKFHAGEGGNRDRLLKELDFMKGNGITNLRMLVK